MKYRKSPINYAKKHGVSKASRKYNKARSYIYFWQRPIPRKDEQTQEVTPYHPRGLHKSSLQSEALKSEIINLSREKVRSPNQVV